MADFERLTRLHPAVAGALLQQYDRQTLEDLKESGPLELSLLAGRILDYRRKRSRQKNSTHLLNYPIDEVLDDYVNRRKGKLVEARRQLKKRFDGLDHDKQEAVMMAFMQHGGLPERNFIYDKLYGDEFWTDEYIPLLQEWLRLFPDDDKLAKVIVKYCPREYILEHLDELAGRCNQATLCLRTGITPAPGRLKPWTYLYVLKSSGGQPGFREGEELILKWVRQYLYEEATEEPVCSIYDIPYVRRMLLYLGEMGMVEDILAVDAFDKQMQFVHRTAWGTAAIKAIEEEFNFPPFVYRNVD